ncbi:MAG: serine/threonine protein kinase [Ardenticatenaceae bacterium]|nr:serine/threonine protein kinase [Anaerolineales bacterium]MCB8979852.1 serine/threonine protein kinase [Ardenticatenaceae bacterium]
MDLTGRHLGKYELLERVGKGGMAYVYKAYQPTVDRLVAVKVLHSHLAEDGEFLERFRREAKGLGSLRHPHIVSVIDFDVDDGWYYMVMDFIEGETLEAVLDRRGSLPVSEALALTAKLAGALAYAHENGRIHRDIKPGNIMFADVAQQHPVITDFGLTRLLDNATLTISGTIAGTPAYMSPEAAQGQKTDARSDIYSLGVMLYEMVTGRRPYLGETPLSVIMKLVMEPLPPALSLNPDLPPAVDEILSKAMAKQPEERYQSAVELWEAVKKETGDWRLEIGKVEPALAVQTQILQPKTAVLPQKPMTQSEVTRAKRPLLPWLLGGGLLLALLVVGLVLRLGKSEGDGVETAVPTAELIETAVPAGSLRFAEPDGNNLRRYTLSLDEVPPPPDGLHYELWFNFANQPEPENVAEVLVENGRVTYADVLVDSLAVNVTGVQISLEPDVDDDPAISADVAFAGTVTDTGLAEVEMFALGD